ncbi:MAG: ABC transporter ATP-binding protein [Candidatus Devosia phytovorans]|uniref:ABC transporter ATP-binding protein n=1 Tax=Candidatus Devosia phytovorans TaxID=3121372 RepID=A0AAJ5VQL0_9HYPH|nr:ABC transporter ATP-binding protein [Devosia sp.]WEK02938.1 MAG: ABC transporter ATP-binding protein [Devosia sp.]
MSSDLVPAEDTILEVRNLSVSFTRSGKQMKAVDDVSFSVAAGETLGLVGESGSGKTTIGRAILRLLPGANTTSGGDVRYKKTYLNSLSSTDMRLMREKLQMIFQDPLSSFNPRRNVEDIVAEGLVIQGKRKGERAERVKDALNAVGFDLETVAGRKPHQFSGGQCQRIAIARSLAVEPELIVCDEPVASLDVSVQAQVINLLQDIRENRKLALIFISHDLAVVKNVSDRVAVLYMGRIVELGTGPQIYDRPAHPYTRTLLEAVPVVDASRKIMPDGKRTIMPSRNRPQSGCAFRTRCPRASDICVENVPVLTEAPNGQAVACHHPHDEPAPGMAA